MNRSDEEIRKLQALVYGPSAHVTKENIDRLAALQYTGPSDQEIDVVDIVPSGISSKVDPGDSDHGSNDGLVLTDTDRSLSKESPWYRSRFSVAGAFAAVFVLGIGAGVLGAHASASPTPVVGVIPPEMSRFDSDSVVYFGEIDGVRVWTATLRDEGLPCLIAAQDGTGGVACLPSPETTAAIDLNGNSDGLVRTVSINLSEDGARPTVVTTHPET